MGLDGKDPRDQAADSNQPMLARIEETHRHIVNFYLKELAAAQDLGRIRELVDPEPAAVGSIREVLARYPDLEPLVPAMGYGETQMAELTETLNAVDADLVLAATPIDLGRLLEVDKPVTRVRYELAQAGGRPLGELVAEAVETAG